MSLHAGLDMASPERERELLLLLLICGSSGLLLPSAERELTRDFYKLEIRSAASSPPRRWIRRRASRSSSPSGVYFYHSVPFITLDSWNCACCSLATAALCGGLLYGAILRAPCQAQRGQSMSSALMKQFSVTFLSVCAFPFFNARGGSAPPAVEEKSAGCSNSLFVDFYCGEKKN